MRIPVSALRRVCCVVWIAFVSVVASACSDDETPSAASATEQGSGVLKKQTDALDKARDVERQLGEAAARQKKAIQ